MRRNKVLTIIGLIGLLAMAVLWIILICWFTWKIPVIGPCFTIIMGPIGIGVVAILVVKTIYFIQDNILNKN